MTGRPAEIASIFGAALAKRTEDCVLIIFDTSAKVMKYVRSDSVLSIARSMNFHWGGTDCSAPIRLLMKNKEVIDNFVILTDGEHWHGGYGPDEAWKDYRKKFNGEALAFHINLQPYGDYLASETDKSVHLVQGWSDDVLRYIAYCNSEEDQLEAVKAIEI
jgi:60 kDa SS-A/Ro ribonucleoprotein